MNSNGLKKSIKRIFAERHVSRVIESRVKKSNLLDEIWVATTKMKADKVFKKFVKLNEINFFKVKLIMYYQDITI